LTFEFAILAKICDAGGTVLPDPFQGMGLQRNFVVTQQSGHATRLGINAETRPGQRSKMEKIVPHFCI